MRAALCMPRFLSADNYGTNDTTSMTEFWFVADPEGPHGCIWPVDTKLRGSTDAAMRARARQPKPPGAFDEHRRLINEQLRLKSCAPLGDEEQLGARLYTGPMYLKYNAVLRGLATGAPRFMVESFERLCEGNRYTTTLHVINSVCTKLAHLQRAEKVYRGVSGGVLPDAFWTADDVGCCGGVEMSMMSTTLDRSVALHYAASRGGAGVLLEIDMGMVDRGCDISWVSQVQGRPGEPRLPSLLTRPNTSAHAPVHTATTTDRPYRHHVRSTRMRRKFSLGRSAALKCAAPVSKALC